MISTTPTRNSNFAPLLWHATFLALASNLMDVDTIIPSMPIASLLLRDSSVAYQIIFVFAGIFMATYKTAMEGILLEISTDENRATYAGISGAGNILTTLFPLVAGFLILALGYIPVFIAVSLVILLSFYFVLKIDCSTSPEKQRTNKARRTSLLPKAPGFCKIGLSKVGCFYESR